MHVPWPLHAGTRAVLLPRGHHPPLEKASTLPAAAVVGMMSPPRPPFLAAVAAERAVRMGEEDPMGVPTGRGYHHAASR